MTDIITQLQELGEDNYSHLLESARETAALSAKERITAIRADRWIGYPRAREILTQLEELINYPPKARMPNLLIVGHTNNGKTKIVDRFMSMTMGPMRLDDITVTSVLKIEFPPGPSLGQTYSTILTSLGIPHRQTARADTLQPLAIKALRDTQVRMLIIDEIQHLLNATPLAQRQMLALLKFLGNQLQIPIVGLGTEEAWNAIRSDAQLTNRFDPAVLPLWRDERTILQLLASFAQMLPLRKPSRLVDRAIAKLVIDVTGGLMGEITALMEASAIHAVKTGAERITLDGIKACGYRSRELKRHDVEFL